MKSLVAFCVSLLAIIVLHFTTTINNLALAVLAVFFWSIIWIIIHILTYDGQVAPEYNYNNSDDSSQHTIN